MKRFAFAVICTFALVSVVIAEEFTAIVTKVQGRDVTFFKVNSAGGPVTTTTSIDVKVNKAKFDKDTNRMVAGDAIEGGLSADILKDIDQEKGMPMILTIADDGGNKGKITQIIVMGKGKKAKSYD
jgi:hypothetical protein